MSNIDEIARINELRNRVVQNGEISLEEAREAIQLLRSRRSEAMGKHKSNEEAKVPLNLNDLFDKPVEGGK